MAIISSVSPRRHPLRVLDFIRAEQRPNDCPICTHLKGTVISFGLNASPDVSLNQPIDFCLPEVLQKRHQSSVKQFQVPVQNEKLFFVRISSQMAPRQGELLVHT